MQAGTIFIIQILIAVLACVAATVLAMIGQYVLAGIFVLALLVCISRLRSNYQRNTNDIIFLLSAIENGDYSIRFSEPKGKQKRTLIIETLNRIKEILSATREEVKANEHFLSIIIERMPLGVIILGPKDRILNSNQAAQKLLGLSHLSRIEHLENISPNLPQLLGSMKSGAGSTIELCTERQSLKLNVQLSSIEIRGTAYKLYTLNNIGQEFEAFEAESWIRLIRVMTHEIMNSVAPITSISDTLLSEMQEEDGEDKRQLLLQGLGTIRDTGKGLLNFVDDYRQFTAIPSPQKTNIVAAELIEQVLTLLSRQIEDAGIELDRSGIDPFLIVHADRQQLQQVLLNLIKNATEAPYSIEQRIIRIKIYESAEKGKHCIEIANNGEPIPAEILSNIFIPFYTTKDGGSGIGLSLSRYILQLHAAKLFTHRDKDGFTCFTVELNAIKNETESLPKC